MAEQEVVTLTTPTEALVFNNHSWMRVPLLTSGSIAERFQVELNILEQMHWRAVSLYLCQPSPKVEQQCDACSFVLMQDGFGYSRSLQLADFHFHQLHEFSPSLGCKLAAQRLSGLPPVHTWQLVVLGLGPRLCSILSIPQCTDIHLPANYFVLLSLKLFSLY